MTDQEPSRFKKIVDDLKKKLAEKPLGEELTYSHESRALNMQKDLKQELEKNFSRSLSEYTPTQWAVRTSMDEMRNAEAFDGLIQEIGDEIRGQVANDLEMTTEELENYFKNQGNQIDQNSAREAYVIVEFNIDHKHFQDPSLVARQFFEILGKSLSAHRPDRYVIDTDKLTSLAHGEIPSGESALFESTCFFV